MKFKIPFYEPSIGREEKKNVNVCLDTNWISSKGKFVGLFENKFKNFVKSKYAVSVCNGTVALHLALLALDINEKHEVIVPTFTYIASVNAIKYVNAKPIFIDSKISDLQIDENKITNKISKKTKAIIVPHIYGQICNIEKIKAICKKKKIFLIEDCAEAFGSYYKKKHAGTFGDISTFSFFGSKTITTGEGGMVITNNKYYANKIERLKMVGVVKNKFYWHNMIGYNYRMTNICAAIGCAQLKNAKKILKSKKKIFESYFSNLKELPIKIHKQSKNTIHSYWIITLTLQKKGLRDKLIAYLKKFKIETRPAFYLVHEMPMYISKKRELFAGADFISKNSINLPSGPNLTKKQIKFVTDKIRDFLDKN